MIKPSELRNESAEEAQAKAHVEEQEAIAKRFDGHILHLRHKILSGEFIRLMIYDVENQYNSLEKVIEEYKNAGWFIKSYRPWSALFHNVIISMTDSIELKDAY